MDMVEFDWRREACALGSVASAVSMAMFAQLAIDVVETAVVETAVVARLGALPLAGVTLALGVHAVVFLFALGVVTAVTPLAAQAAGRGDTQAVRRIGQNGLWMALTVATPLAGAMLVAALVLPASGPEMREAARYIAGAAWGLPGWVAYVAIRCLAIATGRVRVATAIMLVAVPMHALLAVTLVFGAGWGTFGAGLAYALTAYAALGVLAAILALSDQGELGAALRGPPAVDRATCWAILHLGLPFALRIVLREAVLPVAAFGLTPYGAAAVAAHGVASRVVMLAGVFSYGFSDAANLHVGRAIAPARWTTRDGPAGSQ
jgi:multidrug resistance protein, MATE family